MTKRVTILIKLLDEAAGASRVRGESSEEPQAPWVSADRYANKARRINS